MAASAAAAAYRHSAYEAMRVQPPPARAAAALAPSDDALSRHLHARTDAFLFSIFTSASDADLKGRRAIARSTIEPGALLVRETARAAVVRADHCLRFCAACAKELDSSSSASSSPSSSSSAVPTLACQACRCVAYCSRLCLMRHIRAHRHQCAALARSDEISEQSAIAADLVRAAIVYAVERGTDPMDDASPSLLAPTQSISSSSSSSLSSSSSSLTSSLLPMPSSALVSPSPASASLHDRGSAVNFRSSWADVDGMVANDASLPSEQMHRMRHAASLIRKMLPLDEMRREREAAVASLQEEGSSTSAASSSFLTSSSSLSSSSSSSSSSLLSSSLPPSSSPSAPSLSSSSSLSSSNSLPAQSSVSSDDALVSFMCRVNSNCHALTSQLSGIDFGFGLFPLCSILNSSCFPNCVYVSSGQSLEIRTISCVQPGEELTVNYNSLYASLLTRRAELRLSKSFDCDCRRCCLAPATEEERAKFEHDQYVSGIRCREKAKSVSSPAMASATSSDDKRCQGIYRLMKPLRVDESLQKLRQREKLKSKKKAHLKRKKEAAKASSSAASSAENESKEEEEEKDERKEEQAEKVQRPSSSSSLSAAPSPASDPSLSYHERSFVEALSWLPVHDFPSLLCNQCGAELSLAEARDIEARCRRRTEDAQQEYGITYPEATAVIAAAASSSSASSSVDAARQQLQSLHDSLMRLMQQLIDELHPRHGFIFALKLPLINLQNALGMSRERRECVQSIVDCATACFPASFLPLVGYLTANANALRAQALNKATPAKLVSKLEAERQQLLLKIASIREICCGAPQVAIK